jgi:hypothetical protein
LIRSAKTDAWNGLATCPSTLRFTTHHIAIETLFFILNLQDRAQSDSTRAANFERLEDVENETNTTEEEVEEVIPHIMGNTRKTPSVAARVA